MDSTLKTKLNAIQPKAVDTTKYPAVTDPVHYLDPTELNTLIDAAKANNADVESAQSTANAAQTAASNAASTASAAQTVANNAQNKANSIVLSLSLAGTPNNADAPNYLLAKNDTQLWISNGTTWTEIKGGTANPLAFTLYELKSTVSDGWAVRFTYRNDGGLPVTVERQIDSGTWVQVSPVWVTNAWEFSVSGQTASLHTMGLRISDGTNNATASALTIDLAAPTVSGVNISGNTTAGSVLTGNYTYSDVGSSPEGVSAFRWLRNGVVIAGATAKTYTLVNADLGTTITFEVTPVATTGGNLVGTPVQSSGLSVPVPVLTGLGVSAGNAQNIVSWNAGVAGATYNLYWGLTSGVTKANGTKISGVTSPYTHSPLTNGTTYYYVVTQVVNGVESAESTVQSGAPANIILYTFDGASGTAPDTSFFTVMKTSGGVAQLNGSGQLELNSAAVADGELVYRTNAINRTAVKTYKVKFQVPSTTGFTKQMPLILTDNTTKTAPDGNTAGVNPVAPLQRVQMQVTYDATNGLRFIAAYRNTDTANTNPYVIWDTSTNSFVLSSATWAGKQINTNTVYTIVLETTSTQWRATLKSGDEGTILMQTAWVNWTDTMVFTNSAWMCMGDPWTDYHTGKILIEEFAEI